MTRMFRAVPFLPLIVFTWQISAAGELVFNRGTVRNSRPSQVLSLWPKIRERHSPRKNGTN